MGNHPGFDGCKQGCANVEPLDGDLVVGSYVHDTTLAEYVECILTGAGVPVHLNVYHLNDAWRQSNHISNQLFGIGGAFHVGIQVHCLEWSYGGDGIECMEPRTQQVHVFHQSLLLGETDVSYDEVESLIEGLQSEWPGDEYDMLENNCCNFSEAFSQVLVGGSIPAWVLRFPQIASQAAAHLDNVIDIKRMITPEADDN